MAGGWLGSRRALRSVTETRDRVRSAFTKQGQFHEIDLAQIHVRALLDQSDDCP